MAMANDPLQNHLIAALPAADFERLQGKLKLVPLPLGKVLYESGSRLRQVYFPTTSIVSLLYVMADGASAEIAVVGNEGIIGVSLFMGGETTPSRAVVQSAGHAYQLTGKLLKEEFTRAGACSTLLLRHAGLDHANGATAVARHHSLDQQLCRWLLLSLDRLVEQAGNDAAVDRRHARRASRRRHGSGRPSAKAGLIEYSRGRITVLNRTGLRRVPAK
jgi:CRP-like cAMP-binding protein